MKKPRQNWKINTSHGNPDLYTLFRHGVIIPFNRVERHIQASVNKKPVRWEWWFVRGNLIVAIIDNRSRFVGEAYILNEIKDLDDPPITDGGSQIAEGK